MSWTDERVATISRLWLEGQSAGQISKRIGATRNAVIGKISRLKLPSRPLDIAIAAHAIRARTAGRARSRIESARAAILADAQRRLPYVALGQNLQSDRERRRGALARSVVEQAPDEAVRKPLLELSPGDCRWPLGEGPYVFCACPREGPGAYCEFHAQLAIAPRFAVRRIAQPRAA